MDVEKPGDFAVEIHLYVADPETREIHFTIHGIATTRRGAADKSVEAK